MRPPFGTGVESGGGGWMSQSSSDMSIDSEEEEIPRFVPREHDPVEVCEAMELRAADKKDMSATGMLRV